MSRTERITAIVLEAIDEANRELPPDATLGTSPDAPIYGKEGKLDSLGLVSLIVAIEQGLDERLGVAVSLTDDRAVSQSRSPFRTVGAIVNYIAQRLEEQSSE